MSRFTQQIWANEFGHVHLPPPPRLDPAEYNRMLKRSEEERREKEQKRAKEIAENAAWERKEAEELRVRRATNYTSDRNEIAKALSEIQRLRDTIDTLHQESRNAKAIMGEVAHSIPDMRDLAKRQLESERIIPMLETEVKRCTNSIAELTDQAELAASHVWRDLGKRFSDWQSIKLNQLQAGIQQSSLATCGTELDSKTLDNLLQDSPAAKAIKAAVALPYDTCVNLQEIETAIAQVERLQDSGEFQAAKTNGGSPEVSPNVPREGGGTQKPANEKKNRIAPKQ
jgi:hypothetical protein